MNPSERPRPFRPLPLLGNPHVQTILGQLLSGEAPRVAARPHLVTLPDGDRVVLHDFQPAPWRAGERIALLIHGLGGSYRSGSVQRLAALLLPHGLRVVCMDLRGAGAGIALARRSYNAGSSQDVRAAVEAIGRWSPASPLALAGLSLGGNIVLKLAAEAAALPLPNLERVAAVSAPVDLERCAALLAAPRNRVYDRHYVRALVRQAVRQRRHFPELPPLRFPHRMTLRRFDDLYTAPNGGYADALDYYRRASAAPLLGRIAVPTFVLTARDDPFVTVGPFEALAGRPGNAVHVPERGGHLGFLGWDGAGGIRWAERCLADWLLRPMPAAPRTAESC